MPLRKDDAMFGKKLLAIAAALLLASCTATGTGTTTNPTTSTDTDVTLSESERPDPSLDALANTSAIAVAAGGMDRSTRRPLLAIEIEVTPESIKPVGVRIVQASPLANSAHDELRVRIEGAQEFEYTIADPLAAVIHEDGGTRTITLESARTHVFAPLLPSLRTLTIEPVAGPEPPRTRGGTIDLRALVEDACRNTRLQLPICQQILGQR